MESPIRAGLSKLFCYLMMGQTETFDGKEKKRQHDESCLKFTSHERLWNQCVTTTTEPFSEAAQAPLTNA